jgi:hypothetical protein
MAGSPRAVFETMAYLAAAARMFVEFHPEPKHHFTIFVEDVAVQAVGDTAQSCATAFGKAAGWLISRLQDDLALPIEKENLFDGHLG